MKTYFQLKQWTLLFCLSEMLSTVGASATSPQQNVLIGVVGETLTFPTRVTVSGSIIYKGENIGTVVNKNVEYYREFKNRLHWDSQTGIFTVRDLSTNDTGDYTVDISKENRKDIYHVNVFDKVSAPEVTNTTYNSSERELCSLLCSVKNEKGLNLFWYKGSIILNHTNSSSSDDTLYLPLEIKKLDNDIFSCVASNPASKQTTTVNIKELCPHKPDEAAHGDRMYIAPVAVCSVIAVVVVVVTAVCIQRRNHQNHAEDSSATEGLHHEVQYSVITHKNRAQGNICEPVSQETNHLTTVYDQIRPQRP